VIAADGPVAVTEPVIMEVLAGARSDARAAADLDRLARVVGIVLDQPPSAAGRR